MQSTIIDNELYITEESVYDVPTKDKSVYEIYYSTIRYFPILTDDEVKYLFNIYANDKVRSNKEKAKNDLINCHLRLVCKYGHKYSYRTKRLDVNDLIQEGNIILLKAVESYLLIDKDIPFIAYLCSMLKYGLMNIIYEKDNLYRVPSNVMQDYYKIKKAYEFLHKYNKNKITTENLIKVTGLTEKKIKTALRLVQEEIYIDKKIDDSDSNSKSYGDLLIDSTALELHEILIEEELKKDIGKAFTSLTRKEKNVLIQVIEAEHRNISIDKVALDNFINKKDIVEIKQKAIKKLRQNQKISSYQAI